MVWVLPLKRADGHARRLASHPVWCVGDQSSGYSGRSVAQISDERSGPPSRLTPAALQPVDTPKIHGAEFVRILGLQCLDIGRMAAAWGCVSRVRRAGGRQGASDCTAPARVYGGAMAPPSVTGCRSTTRYWGTLLLLMLDEDRTGEVLRLFETRLGA